MGILTRRRCHQGENFSTHTFFLLLQLLGGVILQSFIRCGVQTELFTLILLQSQQLLNKLSLSLQLPNLGIIASSSSAGVTSSNTTDAEIREVEG